MAADRLREEDTSQPPATGHDHADSLATREGRRSSNVRLLPVTGAESSESAPAASQTPKPETKQSAPALSGRKAGRSGKPAEPPRFRSLDLTGNVRMLTDQDIADLATDALERGEPALAKPTPARSAAPSTWVEESAEPSWSEAAPSWSSWSTSASPDATAAAKSGPAGAPRSAAAPLPAAAPAVRLPVAGYDELSLPSLRARLRQLNVDQLEILLSYERSHDNRDDVVTMFERRIAKLNELDE